MSQNKRWYDVDPTISLAISIIRNANIQNQDIIAQFILEKAKEHGIQREKKISLFGFLKNRWYDSNENLFNAFELMKLAPFDVQKEMAIEAINYLCSHGSCINEELV